MAGQIVVGAALELKNVSLISPVPGKCYLNIAKLDNVAHVVSANTPLPDGTDCECCYAVRATYNAISQENFLLHWPLVWQAVFTVRVTVCCPSRSRSIASVQGDVKLAWNWCCSSAWTREESLEPEAAFASAGWSVVRLD